MNANFINKGIYSTSEIASLTGGDPSIIRRWVGGYSYKRGEESRLIKGLFEPEFGKVDGRLTFSFHDLVEMLFVVRFQQMGVRLPTIRSAFLIAKDRFDSKHPFSHLRFKTDGKSIFEEAAERGQSRMTNLNTGQMVFAKIIDQSLFQALEFRDNLASVWYPKYPSRKIVVDPARAFGKPVLSTSGVPVEVIAAAYEADKNYSMVASDYDIPVSDVKAAVGFNEAFG